MCVCVCMCALVGMCTSKGTREGISSRDTKAGGFKVLGHLSLYSESPQNKTVKSSHRLNVTAHACPILGT